MLHACACRITGLSYNELHYVRPPPPRGVVWNFMCMLVYKVDVPCQGLHPFHTKLIDAVAAYCTC